MTDFWSYRSKSFSDQELLEKVDLICDRLFWNKIDEGEMFVVYETPRSIKSAKLDITFEVLANNINILLEPHNPAFPNTKLKGIFIRDFIRSFQLIDEL